MKHWRCVLLCALLVLTACSHQPQTEDSVSYELYFCDTDFSGAADSNVYRTELATMKATDDLEVTLTTLMEELLEGPKTATLKSMIPAGTELLSLDVSHGYVLVDLSSSYGALSGITLTLADHAIVQTLTQVPGVYSVSITVQGQTIAYRDKQLFTARDILLPNQGDVVSTVQAELYFLNADGELVAELRELDLYEGDTQVGALIQALGNGPQNSELRAVLPEEFWINTVWQEEGICYVSLPSVLLESLPDLQDLSVALPALAGTLCSLDGVEEVRFLVDGNLADSYGGVRIDQPYIY